MEEQAYIVFDGSNKPLPWPPELHGQPTRIFKQSRSGGWEAFLKAVEKPREARGIMIAAPPQSLSIMVSGLKAHYPHTFLDLMKMTLVLLTEDEDSAQVEPLKRLYGFRTLVLSSWSEDHLMDFIGNIFQPPLESIPEMPRLEGSQMGATQMVDYYQLIGLQQTASQKEIHAALTYYREYWSDRARNPETRPKAEYSLALISQAESLLLEPAKRERYDAVLQTVRTQPKGKGPRGTRLLNQGGTGGPGDDLYQPTAWTRETGITSGGRAEDARLGTRDARDARDAARRAREKDDSVYRPPAWSREEREPDHERRGAPHPDQADEGAVYRPPSWSRHGGDATAAEPERHEPDGGASADPAAKDTSARPDAGPEAGPQAISGAGPDAGSSPIEGLIAVADSATPPGDTLPPAREREIDPSDPEAILLGALDDPELDPRNLPGLGKRREDPGGEPWPPKEWPPKGWVARESQLLEEYGTLARTEEAPLPTSTDSPAAPEDDEAAEDEALLPAEGGRSALDVPVLSRVPVANLDVEVWASSFLALEPGAAFPAEAGMLLGTRFEVGERLHYVVSGTYSLAGEPPGERIGYYVRTRPDSVAEAAEALVEHIGAVTTVDLALAVDLGSGTGRFFKIGASKRPFAASPVVRLSSWQTAGPAPGDRFVELLRRNRWSLLAAFGILFLGAFTWSLYQSLGGPLEPGMPALEKMAINSYIRADGVVLKWMGAFDKVAIYRIDAGDSTAHWKLISRRPNTPMGYVDPEPVRRPGRYRYLVVATSTDPHRTLLSDIQALDVR